MTEFRLGVIVRAKPSAVTPQWARERCEIVEIVPPGRYPRTVLRGGPDRAPVTRYVLGSGTRRIIRRADQVEEMTQCSP